MQQIVAILLLSLAIFASALTIKPAIGLNSLQSAEDLTFSIRRLEPHEAAQGNMYHLFKEHMASLNSSIPRVVRGAQAIDWGTITNIGQQIWDIIVKNQPTSSIKTAFGSAVPVSMSRHIKSD